MNDAPVRSGLIKPPFEPVCVDPSAIFRMAAGAGLPRAQTTTEVLAFALAVAEYCAEIGDAYTVADSNCGREIRARFGLDCAAES